MNYKEKRPTMKRAEGSVIENGDGLCLAGKNAQGKSAY